MKELMNYYFYYSDLKNVGTVSQYFNFYVTNFLNMTFLKQYFYTFKCQSVVYSMK